jgi:uncharacterized iron-regulated membrane protein
MTFHAVRRTLFTVHMWVGLILGILLAALGLSGSLLVYDDKIAQLLAPAPRAETAGDPLPLSMIEDIAARAAGEKGVHGQMQIVLPDEVGHAISIRMGGLSPMGNMAGMNRGGVQRNGERRRARDERPEGARGNQLQIFVDPVSGEVLGTRKALLPPILTFAHQLHGNFLMGREGRAWAVGPLGVAMCLLGLTGLVLWWPKRGQWKYAFLVRKTATGLRFHRELHAATGIWIFAVFMIVSFSGVVIAWPQTMGMNPPGFNPRVQPTVAPQDGKILGATEAVAIAQKALPGAQLRSITIPARPGQAIAVQFLAHEAINAQVYLNPYSGAVLQVRDQSENPMAWQRPIHQGLGFGAVWKFLVFLSGLVPLLFVVTGIIMWAKKRRRRVPMTMLTDDVIAGDAA